MFTVNDVYTMAAALIGDHEDNSVSGTPMTVRQVYAIAAAFIGDREGDDNDERDFSPIYMNILLQEALETENSIRASHGEPELGNAPVVCCTKYTSSGYSSVSAQYGVYGYSISGTGTLSVRRRYSSSTSGTINGTFVTNVYALDLPDGLTLFTVG